MLLLIYLCSVQDFDSYNKPWFDKISLLNPIHAHFYNDQHNLSWSGNRELDRLKALIEQKRKHETATGNEWLSR
jgi:hypothetical protein